MDVLQLKWPDYVHSSKQKEGDAVSKVKFAGRIHTPIQIYHLHSHPYWEVVCYTQGIGTVEIDGNIVSFETGEIFFPPARPHSFPPRRRRLQEYSLRIWGRLLPLPHVDQDSRHRLRGFPVGDHQALQRIPDEAQELRRDRGQFARRAVALSHSIFWSGSPSSLCRNSHQPNRYKLLRPFLRLESNNDSHSYEPRLFP